MFYTIYKITNKINGKFYIGMHRTTDLNDEYMGSGTHLRKSIKKYGKENFIKETLFVFDNESEMYCKEAELVTEEHCSRPDTYNICSGGKGGWGYVNHKIFDTEKRLEHNRKYTKFYDPEFRSKYVNSSKGGLAAAPKTRERLKKLHKEGKIFTKGSKHSEETKRKIGIKSSANQQGSKNSQFGTCWISNGLENKKVKKEDFFFWEEKGYVRGRKTLKPVK